MSTNKTTKKTDEKGRKKMPIKIIMYIIVMVVVAIFLGINGNNACDINLVFRQFTNVPVITTILISFAAGIFVMLPFTFGRKKKNKTQASTVETKNVHKTVSPKKEKKGMFGKKKTKQAKNPTELKSDNTKQSESATVGSNKDAN